MWTTYFHAKHSSFFFSLELRCEWEDTVDCDSQVRRIETEAVLFGFSPSAIVRGNASYNVGTALLQVGAASLTFIPRYMHRMFEFRIGIVFICTDTYPIPETFRLDIGKCMCHPYAQLFVLVSYQQQLQHRNPPFYFLLH